jgi:hypothetical protein
MADLEVAAQPLLTPMMMGQPVNRDPAQQLVVATWATKTVMAIEPSLTHDENFPPSLCEIVRTQGRPPASVEVVAGAVEGPIPPMGFSAARVQMEINGAPFIKYHFYTLYLGTLVLQVLRPDPPPPNYGTLERMTVPTEIALSPDEAIVIFPPSGRRHWPPRTILDWDGVVTFTHRGLPMPDEWRPQFPNPRT